MVFAGLPPDRDHAFRAARINTVPDLHGSLGRNRLWAQLGRLRDAAAHPYLLIEGTDLDAGPGHPNAIRGALLAIADAGITLLWSRDPDDTALWINRLAVSHARRQAKLQRPDQTVRPNEARSLACGVATPHCCSWPPP